MTNQKPFALPCSYLEKTWNDGARSHVWNRDRNHIIEGWSMRERDTLQPLSRTAEKPGFVSPLSGVAPHVNGLKWSGWFQFVSFPRQWWGQLQAINFISIGHVHPTCTQRPKLWVFFYFLPWWSACNCSPHDTGKRRTKGCCACVNHSHHMKIAVKN